MRRATRQRHDRVHLVGLDEEFLRAARPLLDPMGDPARRRHAAAEHDQVLPPPVLDGVFEVRVVDDDDRNDGGGDGQEAEEPPHAT